MYISNYAQLADAMEQGTRLTGTRRAGPAAAPAPAAGKDWDQLLRDYWGHHSISEDDFEEQGITVYCDGAEVYHGNGNYKPGAIKKVMRRFSKYEN